MVLPGGDPSGLARRDSPVGVWGGRAGRGAAGRPAGYALSVGGGAAYPGYQGVVRRERVQGGQALAESRGRGQ
jgi:hypothetical protein